MHTESGGNSQAREGHGASGIASLCRLSHLCSPAGIRKMTNRGMQFALVVSAFNLIGAGSANADYRATGTAEATICKGFILKHCSTYPVIGLYNNGVTVDFPRLFSSVREHNSRIGFCWVNSSAVFVMRGDDGAPFQSKVDYIAFSCKEE